MVYYIAPTIWSSPPLDWYSYKMQAADAILRHARWLFEARLVLTAYTQRDLLYRCGNNIRLPLPGLLGRHYARPSLLYGLILSIQSSFRIIGRRFRRKISLWVISLMSAEMSRQKYSLDDTTLFSPSPIFWIKYYAEFEKGRAGGFGTPESVLWRDMMRHFRSLPQNSCLYFPICRRHQLSYNDFIKWPLLNIMYVTILFIRCYGHERRNIIAALFRWMLRSRNDYLMSPDSLMTNHAKLAATACLHRRPLLVLRSAMPQQR